MAGYGLSGVAAPSDSIVGRGADRVRAVPVNAGGGSGVLLGMGGVLLGWSVRESTGAAAAGFDLYDGHDATGSLLGTCALAAGAESQRTLFSEGVDVTAGLYLSVTSGAVHGVVYVRADMGGGV